jgi:SAM-dependent methyltransferase
MREKETSAEFDSYADAYREHVAKALPPGVGEVDAFARVKVWHLIRAIDSVFPGRRNVRILDAGCGIGLTDRYLKAAFPNITGFDVSPKSVELAAQANPELSYCCDPAGQLPFEDGRFEVVFAICVVHHAILAVAGPVLERGALPTSFACRTGLGQDAALRAARRAVAGAE